MDLVMLLSGLTIVSAVFLLIALVKGRTLKQLAWIGAVLLASAGLTFIWAAVSFFGWFR